MQVTITAIKTIKLGFREKDQSNETEEVTLEPKPGLRNNPCRMRENGKTSARVTEGP